VTLDAGIDVRPLTSLIAPAGSPVVGGGVVVPACVTAAVCEDVAELAPLGFVAVTTTRMVLPTSVLATVYVDAVAPEIAAQLLPCASQLCQAYVNVGVVSLVHVPVDAVKTLPTCGVPEIDGAAVFVGA
jgi:hypothetical protein